MTGQNRVLARRGAALAAIVVLLACATTSTVANKILWKEFSTCRNNFCARVQDLDVNAQPDLLKSLCPQNNQKCLDAAKELNKQFTDSKKCSDFKALLEANKDKEEVIKEDSGSLWKECYAEIQAANYKSKLDPSSDQPFFQAYFIDCEDYCIQKNVPPEVPPEKFAILKTYQTCRDDTGDNGCADEKKSCTDGEACAAIIQQSTDAAKEYPICKKAAEIESTLDASNNQYPFASYVCDYVGSNAYVPGGLPEPYKVYRDCIYKCQFASKQPTGKKDAAKPIVMCQTKSCILTKEECQPDDIECVTDFTMYKDDYPTCIDFTDQLESLSKSNFDLFEVDLAQWKTCYDKIKTDAKYQENGAFQKYFLECRDSCINTGAYQSSFKKASYKIVDSCRVYDCKDEVKKCKDTTKCTEQEDLLSKCVKNQEATHGACVAANNDRKTDVSLNYAWSAHLCDTQCQPKDPKEAGGDEFVAYLKCYNDCEDETQDLSPEDVEKTDYKYKDLIACQDKYLVQCPVLENGKAGPDCSEPLKAIADAFAVAINGDGCQKDLRAMKAGLTEDQIKDGDYPYPKRCADAYATIDEKLAKAYAPLSQLYVQVSQQCAKAPTKMDEYEKAQIKATIDEYNTCLQDCGECPYGASTCEAQQAAMSLCMASDENKQCDSAIQEYFTRKGTDNYPFELYVCRLGCVPVTDKRDTTLAKIEECRDRCSAYEAVAPLSYRTVDQCIANFCADSFEVDTDQQRLYDALRAKVSKDCAATCDNLIWTQGAVLKSTETMMKKACQDCVLKAVDEQTQRNNAIYDNYVTKCHTSCFQKGEYLEAVKVQNTKIAVSKCIDDIARGTRCEDYPPCVEKKMAAFFGADGEGGDGEGGDGEGGDTEESPRCKCEADQVRQNDCESNTDSRLCKIGQQRFDAASQRTVYPFQKDICRLACRPQVPEDDTRAYSLYQKYVSDCVHQPYGYDRTNYEQVDYDMCVTKSVAQPFAETQPKSADVWKQLNTCYNNGDFKGLYTYTKGMLNMGIKQCDECRLQLQKDSIDAPQQKLKLPMECKECAQACAKDAEQAPDIAGTNFKRIVTEPWIGCYDRPLDYAPDEAQTYQDLPLAEECRKYDDQPPCDKADCAKEYDRLIVQCRGNTQNAQCVNALKRLRVEQLSGAKARTPWELVFCELSCRAEKTDDTSYASLAIDRDVKCQTNKVQWPGLARATYTFADVYACVDQYAPLPGSEKDKAAYDAYTKCMRGSSTGTAATVTAECKLCAKGPAYGQTEALTEKYFKSCLECNAQCLLGVVFESLYVRPIIDSCVKTTYFTYAQQYELARVYTQKGAAMTCVAAVDAAAASCEPTLKCEAERTRIKNCEKQAAVCEARDVALGYIGQDDQYAFEGIMCHEACPPAADAPATIVSQWKDTRRCLISGRIDGDVLMPRQNFEYATADACVANLCFTPPSQFKVLSQLLAEFDNARRNTDGDRNCKLCEEARTTATLAGKFVAVACEACYANAAQSVIAAHDKDAKVSTTELGWFTRYIAQCRTDCFAYGAPAEVLTAADATFASKYVFTTCVERGVYKRSSQLPDWLTYATCKRTAPQCVTAFGVYDTQKPSESVSYALYACHKFCQAFVPANGTKYDADFEDNVEVEEYCFFDQGAEDDKTFYHTSKMLTQCEYTQVPDCNPADTACLRLVQAYRRCTDQTGSSPDDDKNCVECNAWRRLQKPDSTPVPKACAACQLACDTSTVVLIERSRLFSEQILPLRDKCVLYGQVFFTQNKLLSTKASQKACEEKCIKSLPACGQQCLEQETEFVQCTQPTDQTRQCYAASVEYNALNDLDHFPYATYACSLSCYPPDSVRKDTVFKQRYDCRITCMEDASSGYTPTPPAPDPITPPEVDPRPEPAPVEDDKIEKEDDGGNGANLSIQRVTVAFLLVVLSVLIA